MLMFAKSLLINSRIGDLATDLRWVAQAPRRARHPELWETFLEERRLPLVLRKLLQPDSCGVDVGSHLGSFLRLLTKISPQGRHVGFEPSKRRASWLAKRFRNADIFECAASDRRGRLPFQENGGNSRLVEGPDSYNVDVFTLDEVLADRPRVDLIKIDTEGAELSVLRGSQQLISRFRPPIIFECGSEYFLTENKLSRRDLYNFLLGSGYQVCTFADLLHDKGPMGFDEFRKCGLYPFRAFNFIAVP